MLHLWAFHRESVKERAGVVLARMFRPDSGEVLVDTRLLLLDVRKLG